MTRMKKKVFLTGATGSMGLSAARELLAVGHSVIGTVRSPRGAAALTELGAEAVEVSLFDEGAVREATVGCDVIAHFATSIPRGTAGVRCSAWETNDRLRREGTAALITAAEANGIPRFIFESIALAYPDRGAAWIDETATLEEVSPSMGTAIEAEEMLEGFRERGGEAISLRFGRIYGPGRASEDLIGAVRRRQMPIVGRGDNFVSSIHIEDVGTAVAAALSVAPGVYNVVDDEPCSQRAHMTTVAESLGAPPPRRIPVALARLMLGHVTPVLTVSQRVSNQRFREVAGWKPRYPSIGEGWPAVARALEAEVSSVA